MIRGSASAISGWTLFLVHCRTYPAGHDPVQSSFTAPAPHVFRPRAIREERLRTAPGEQAMPPRDGTDRRRHACSQEEDYAAVARR